METGSKIIVIAPVSNEGITSESVKTFHIVWMMPDREEPVSTGKNYEAYLMADAITTHMNEVGIDPIAIVQK